MNPQEAVSAAHRPARVLFVSYCFPPMGGVSVQRVTKFVKYLPEHGWNCSVLTVQDPSEALMDDSLLADVPAATVIRRARSYEPGQSVKSAISCGNNSAQPTLMGRGLGLVKSVVRKAATCVLQPDAQILWRPHALREGLKLLRETPHDAIVATGPPFSSLLLGATLSRRSGLPLVLDYRDEWGISNAHWENRQPGWLVSALQMRMQRYAISTASAVVATTPSSASSLRSLVPDSKASRNTHCIYNGFDADDFTTATDSASCPEDLGGGTNRYRLTLVGSLWNLVPAEPFVAGIERFQSSRPELAQKLEIVCVGHRTEAQERVLDRVEQCGVALRRLPFVPYSQALKLMSSSDALVLLLGDLPGASRVINARTFEYMAARRPILVVAPPGDLWDVVRDLPGTELCRPGEPEHIALSLERLMTRHVSGQRYPASDWQIDRFDRKNLTGKLAALLDNITTHKPRPDGSPLNESHTPNSSLLAPHPCSPPSC